MIKYRRRRANKDPADLNITAFMNLMVVLVPFLLITAVFSRITILELNLPPASENQVKLKKKLELEVILRKDALEVGDRNRGLIKRIESRDGQHDLEALSMVLQQIKAQFPQKNNATILAETTTPYDLLVQVMDAVRVVEVSQGQSMVHAELFPEIAIGDAPMPRQKKRRQKQR
ncbi:MAG: ExbD/TolR family protein [Acidiferrobacterales bacterium]